jgi:hypothetical protein
MVACKPKASFLVSTTDITNFWKAYDELKQDDYDGGIIRKVYMDNGSPGLKKLFKLFNDRITPYDYLDVIYGYPKFWKSIRPETEKLENVKSIVEKDYRLIKSIYPEFKCPDVCFEISPMRWAGTVSDDKKTILIGTEIALANGNVDISEIHNGLEKTICKQDLDILIVHESIHSIQSEITYSKLYRRILQEGSAIFITSYLLKRNGYEEIFTEASKNDDKIQAKIRGDIFDDTKFKEWFGWGDEVTIPDLGYYVGYRIMERYFENMTDKRQAITNIITLNNISDIVMIGKYL